MTVADLMQTIEELSLELQALKRVSRDQQDKIGKLHKAIYDYYEGSDAFGAILCVLEQLEK